jgi:polar amino acid transport system substrate-binding protein
LFFKQRGDKSLQFIFLGFHAGLMVLWAASGVSALQNTPREYIEEQNVAVQQASDPGIPTQRRAKPIHVKVGGYEFEPFVEGDLGVVPAFLTLLNGHQSKYRFDFASMPAQRRYEQLRSGAIDAVFFENPRWGWNRDKSLIEVTAPLMRAFGSFYALKNNPLGMAVFAEPAKRKIGMTLGYHYAFLNYNSDQAYIRSRFDAVFAKSQRISLQLLMMGKTEVALFSDIFLAREFARNPGLRATIISAPEKDQTYDMPLIVRKDGPISVAELTRILDQLVACDCLSAFFKAYGIADQLIYKSSSPQLQPKLQK